MGGGRREGEREKQERERERERERGERNKMRENSYLKVYYSKLDNNPLF
jgi:hypothetical protein